MCDVSLAVCSMAGQCWISLHTTDMQEWWRCCLSHTTQIKAGLYDKEFNVTLTGDNGLVFVVAYMSCSSVLYT